MNVMTGFMKKEKVFLKHTLLCNQGSYNNYYYAILMTIEQMDIKILEADKNED